MRMYVFFHGMELLMATLIGSLWETRNGWAVLCCFVLLVACGVAHEFLRAVEK